VSKEKAQGSTGNNKKEKKKRNRRKTSHWANPCPLKGELERWGGGRPAGRQKKRKMVRIKKSREGEGKLGNAKKAQWQTRWRKAAGKGLTQRKNPLNWTGEKKRTEKGLGGKCAFQKKKDPRGEKEGRQSGKKQHIGGQKDANQ